MGIKAQQCQPDASLTQLRSTRKVQAKTRSRISIKVKKSQKSWKGQVVHQGQEV